MTQNGRRGGGKVGGCERGADGRSFPSILSHCTLRWNTDEGMSLQPGRRCDRGLGFIRPHDSAPSRRNGSRRFPDHLSLINHRVMMRSNMQCLHVSVGDELSQVAPPQHTRACTHTPLHIHVECMAGVDWLLMYMPPCTFLWWPRAETSAVRRLCNCF